MHRNSQEPYVHLPSGDEILGWSEGARIIYNQKRRQQDKWEFYQRAFDWLRENGIKGNYWEFGCHRARTFRMALSAAALQCMNHDMEFHAFDSFQGLPPNDSGHPGWTLGALSTSELEFMELVIKHGIEGKWHLHPGFYKDSLTPALAQEIGKPAFICVDCDLYESAVEVFKFIAPLVQPGCILYIDDAFSHGGDTQRGVVGAWKYLYRGGLRSDQPYITYREYIQVGLNGQSFIAYTYDPSK